MKTISFKNALTEILGNIHRNTKLSPSALSLLDEMVSSLAKKFIKVSVKLSDLAQSKTISVRDINSSTKLLLVGELIKKTSVDAKWNIIKLKVSDKNKKDVTQNLKFKLSTLTSFVSKCSKKRVSKLAVIYFSSVLEYVVSEILELAHNKTRDENRDTITPRDIFYVIKEDSELNVLFKGYILGTGVIPNIHYELLPKSGGALRNKKIKEGIKNITKNGLNKLMFRAGVKKKSMNIYEESRDILQGFLETFLKNTLVIALHKNHKTLMYDDGITALQLLNIDVYSTRGYPGLREPCIGSERIPDTSGKGFQEVVQKYQESYCTLLPHTLIENVVKDIIRHFAHPENISKYKKDFMWLVHALAEAYMIKLYQDAILVALHTKRLTIMPKDLRLVLKLRQI